jgi:catalase
MFDEDQQLAFGFDVLDPTKIIPEELVPLQKLGVMKLHTNPMNYFAETEQVMVSTYAFHSLVCSSVYSSKILLGALWGLITEWRPS